MNKPNPGNNVYLIRLDRRPDVVQYNVFKLDRDGECEQTYTVLQTIKAGQLEYICGCPAYKALCKHIHWVKFLRQKMLKDTSIVGGRHFPKEGTWEFETEST